MSNYQIEDITKNDQESFDAILPLAEEVTARMRVICHKLEVTKQTFVDLDAAYQPLTQPSSKHNFNVGEKISAMP